jgi:integral membrane protein
MTHAPLRRFQLIAILEGVSFLLLLFIAMPLKYAAGFLLAVKYTGWAHGVLFILYVAFLADVVLKYRWSVKLAIIAFLASLLPFGTFVLDARVIKKELKEAEPEG